MAALTPAAPRPHRPPAGEPGDRRHRAVAGRRAGRRHASRCSEEIVERLPDGPMRDRFAQHVTRPTLTLFEPKVAFNGITLLIVPGGGYVRVVIDKEGVEAAEWFTERGFRRRRVALSPARGRLGSGRRRAGARRHARHAPAARAAAIAEWRRAAHRRHGLLGGRPPVRAPDHRTRPRLCAARFGGRPVGASGFRGAHVSGHRHHGRARACGLRPAAAGRGRAALPDLARYSPHLNVSAKTPPTMLVHAADDTSVPVENSLMMYEALRKARRAQRAACVRQRRSWLRAARRRGQGRGRLADAGSELGDSTMPTP